MACLGPSDRSEKISGVSCLAKPCRAAAVSSGCLCIARRSLWALKEFPRQPMGGTKSRFLNGPRKRAVMEAEQGEPIGRAQPLE